MQHKLSVIMSLYRNDTVRYVSLALDSILQQSYRDFDLYIMYDGVIEEEVEKYITSLTDERLNIQKRDENKGLANSLNELLYVVKSWDMII